MGGWFSGSISRSRNEPVAASLYSVGAGWGVFLFMGGLIGLVFFRRSWGGWTGVLASFGGRGDALVPSALLRFFHSLGDGHDDGVPALGVLTGAESRNSRL